MRPHTKSRLPLLKHIRPTKAAAAVRSACGRSTHFARNMSMLTVLPYKRSAGAVPSHTRVLSAQAPGPVAHWQWVRTCWCAGCSALPHHLAAGPCHACTCEGLHDVSVGDDASCGRLPLCSRMSHPTDVSHHVTAAWRSESSVTRLWQPEQGSCCVVWMVQAPVAPETATF